MRTEIIIQVTAVIEGTDEKPIVDALELAVRPFDSTADIDIQNVEIIEDEPEES